MKFDKPAGPNPIDRMTVIGRPHPRIEARFKTTGTAPYAYERHDFAPDPAYGHVLGAGIGHGTIRTMDLSAARAAPGVLAIVTAANAGKLGRGKFNVAPLLGGPDVAHYHQAIALVVAETFEQARAAAHLIRVEYDETPGRYDLAAVAKDAPKPGDDVSDDPPDSAEGDFAAAFKAAPVTLDATYTTPDQSHMMMEPFASIAAWDGDHLTLVTSNQMVDWGHGDIAETLGIDRSKIRLASPYVGGGFGGKLFVRCDAVLAALGARATGRRVKVAITRPMMPNNATHRPATIQRIRIGAAHDGTITAIAHEGWSGNIEGGSPEFAVGATRLLYAGAARRTRTRLARLDLPEGNAMRAPGEAPGLMALEIAMDEMAERLGMDPIAFRIRNDTQVDPSKPDRPFSQRNLTRCLGDGAQRFGWDRRNPRPGAVREGDLLVGIGVASAFRGNVNRPSAARMRLRPDGIVVVETDMTDIGTGSYTVIGQTAAEMLGVPLDGVTVRLGDSSYPVSSGSGGQWGANSSTSGVYAAAVRLRETVARRLGLDPATATFAEARVTDASGRTEKLRDAARDGELVAEDGIEFGDLDKRYQQSTFGAHFVEVTVDRYTGETRIRRMLAVCDAGRILNPVTARSQVIGAMAMGVGGALMERLSVDTRRGFFVNHDLAQYEIASHADIPSQEVVFLDEPDDKVSPMKAKGIGELGLCGVGAAIANAVYNATGVRVRDYPITLDTYLDGLPAIA